MNAEYQRLHAEASEVERQMRELSTTAELSSACGHLKFEQQIADLGRKLASLHQGHGVDSSGEFVGDATSRTGVR